MRRIVIIGSLPGDPNRNDLLSALKQTFPDIIWEWIQAPASTLRPEQKYVRQLQAEADRRQLANTIIVKLRMLRNEIAVQVRALGCRVVEAPNLLTVEELIEWIVSSESKLNPPQNESFPKLATEKYLLMLEYELWKKNGKPGIPPNTGCGFDGGQ